MQLWTSIWLAASLVYSVTSQSPDPCAWDQYETVASFPGALSTVSSRAGCSLHCCSAWPPPKRVETAEPPPSCCLPLLLWMIWDLPPHLEHRDSQILFCPTEIVRPKQTLWFVSLWPNPFVSSLQFLWGITSHRQYWPSIWSTGEASSFKVCHHRRQRVAHLCPDDACWWRASRRANTEGTGFVQICGSWGHSLFSHVLPHRQQWLLII